MNVTARVKAVARAMVCVVAAVNSCSSAETNTGPAEWKGLPGPGATRTRLSFCPGATSPGLPAHSATGWPAAARAVRACRPAAHGSGAALKPAPCLLYQ